MTETILTIGIPTLAVLVGILLNRNDANRLDTRIGTSETALRGEIASARNELHAEISAARKQSHDDVLMLMGIARDQDTRITRLEGHS